LLPNGAVWDSNGNYTANGLTIGQCYAVVPGNDANYRFTVNGIDVGAGSNTIGMFIASTASILLSAGSPNAAGYPVLSAPSFSPGALGRIAPPSTLCNIPSKAVVAISYPYVFDNFLSFFVSSIAAINSYDMSTIPWGQASFITSTGTSTTSDANWYTLLQQYGGFRNNIGVGGAALAICNGYTYGLVRMQVRGSYVQYGADSGRVSTFIPFNSSTVFAIGGNTTAVGSSGLSGLIGPPNYSSGYEPQCCSTQLTVGTSGCTDPNLTWNNYILNLPIPEGSEDTILKTTCIDSMGTTGYWLIVGSSCP
jgi:hypothetical protein